jgi:hypothetical protein
VKHGAHSNQADKIAAASSQATLWSNQVRVGGIPRRASPSQDENTDDASNLMPLKELDCSLVFLGCGLCLKRSQIPALSRFRILLL